MQVLSHRGYWKKIEEKNTSEAFRRSFDMQFGTETDIRDRESQLVIAHDMPDKSCQLLIDFLKIYQSYKKAYPLALNIKADGLSEKIAKILTQYNIDNYFVFDMSVPDALSYIKLGMNVFTRQSEYEMKPSFYDKACGIWLDEFYEHWINQEIIEEHLSNQKKICIVSPELHGRDHKKEWHTYKMIEEHVGKDKLMLCTDLPELAEVYFND